MFVTGSNIFGQWYLDNPILTGFQKIDFNVPLPSNAAKLILINWSYNILKAGNTFYVSGFWKGKEKQCTEVTIPKECYKSETVPTNLILIGNDNYLILCSAKARKFWYMSLEDESLVREITCNVEMPLSEENESKKKKIDDDIIKIAATNNSCLYLTYLGNVYCGLLPSHIHTAHCIGKICEVQCGYEHFMLLTETGRVYTWGNGRRLQLGHGNLDNLDTPTEVAALAGIKIVKICAGGWHCMALSEHGDVYVWGWNHTGQLGIKEQSESGAEDLKSCGLPTILDIYDESGKEVNLNVRDIACGTRHSAILLDDNTLWTSGYNKYGQLGFSPETFPEVRYFKKSFYCKGKFKIKCGPWCTVLEQCDET